MNNIITSSEKSFLYFISNISYQLDLTLINSRIKNKTLEYLLTIYNSVFFNPEPSRINLIVQKNELIEVPFYINLIQAYFLMFKEYKQLFITDQPKKEVFDDITQCIQLLSVAYSVKPDTERNMQKSSLIHTTFFNEKSNIIKDNSQFEINKIRNTPYDLIYFNNWSYQNEKKIIDTLIELDSKGTKVIINIKKDDEKANDLFKSLENSIIVNKININ